jgi:hypothetical protein
VGSALGDGDGGWKSSGGGPFAAPTSA